MELAAQSNNFLVALIVWLIKYETSVFFAVILFFLGIAISFMGLRFSKYTKYFMGFYAGAVVGGLFWIPTLSKGFIIFFGTILGIGAAGLAHVKKDFVPMFFGLSLSATVGILIDLVILSLFGPSIDLSGDTDKDEVLDTVIAFARVMYTFFLLITIIGAAFAHLVKEHIVLVNTTTIGSLFITIALIVFTNMDSNATGCGIKIVLIYAVFFAGSGAFQIWLRQHPDIFPWLPSAPIENEENVSVDISNVVTNSNTVELDMNTTSGANAVPLYSQQAPPQNLKIQDL